MKIVDWDRIKKMRGLLATSQPEPRQQAERIVRMLRDVVLPSKAGVFLVVLYYFFYSGWLSDAQTAPSVTLDTLKKYFLVYLACNFVGAILLIEWRRLPPAFVQWLAFTMGLLDGVFVAGIAIVTGGFSSNAFWIFPALIVLNALTIPLAMPQMVLNVLLSLFYIGAVLLTPHIATEEPLPDQQLLANMYLQAARASLPGTVGLTNGVPDATVPSSLHRGSPGTGTVAQVDPNGGEFHGTNLFSRRLSAKLAKINKAGWRSRSAEDNPADDLITEQLALRVSVLWLLAICCYGTQVLQERQRQALLEAAEFAAREGQLHSAGRLAAEFAHQIKNPLAVINNAAYSLRRSLRENKGSAVQQIEIIQEEVARADKVITQIMGYAQLSEGRVERLQVAEEVDRAIDQVFPNAMPSSIRLQKHLDGPLPVLLMQRNHLAEILANLLLNAREALNGSGNLQLTVTLARDQAVEIVVADDGPGIAPDKLEQIFEAYFTTKEKGTGLGLAIVKHNAELYGGEVRVESVLGHGARFTVTLPAKSQPKPFTK